MGRYRVLHIGSGTEYGGGTTYVLMLMKAIIEHGGEVHFACTPGLTLEAVRSSGYQVFQIPSLQREIRPVADLLALCQLLRVIRKGKYNLVHTHTSKGGFLGRIAARMAGVPVVFHTVHGFAFHDRSSKFSYFLYLFLERFAARFCDKMISVNSEDRMAAVSSGVASHEKIITIYNGINCESFDCSCNGIKIRKELGVGEKDDLVGMVARMAPSKAPLDFVRAAEYVCARRKNVKFVLVGGGPQRAETEHLIRELGLTENIILTGYRTDVPEILAAMDIFILTTLWEGLPIALLEAMAMRKPVVATNVRGPREVIQHRETGLLVPPGDPTAAGEAILWLLIHKEEAKKMGSRGRILVEEVFNAKVMTRKTLAVYEELLKAREIYFKLKN